jgi:hypothetical protein
MAHYAFLDRDNIVTEVIVGKDENEDGIDWEQYYGELRNQLCKRTSYNTLGNKHMDTENGIPFRKNYAGIGYYYDEQRDAFIAPKPFTSSIFDEETCTWNPPVPYPTDGEDYYWNEEQMSWLIVPIPVVYPTDGQDYRWDKETSSWQLIIV